MKTIEQYELEIAQKDAVIREMMAAFSLNIDRFQQVLGKDPQYVYETLEKQWMSTISEYQRTTLRNQDVLQRWSDKLESVISVLNEVASMLRDLDRIAFAQTDPTQSSATVEAKEIAEKVSEQLDNLTSTVQEKIEQAGVQGVQSTWIKGALAGGATFLACRVLGIRPAISMTAAGAAAYFAGKKKG